MADRRLSKVALRNGVWQGVIEGTAGDAPKITVRHKGVQVPDVTLEWIAQRGHWSLLIPIPPAAIADGVEVLLIRDAATDKQIGQITLMAGAPLSEDIRADIALLRAELDMLKRAFRRHCQETT
ncbi:MAG: hypothetical protein AAF943_00730 [Pseudomonadota bacterium]